MSMKKSILEIYALAVCFFTVACFVVTLGIALYDVVQIADPEFTMNRYQYEQYQSNDEIRDSPMAMRGRDGEQRKAMSEEEVTKWREKAYAQALHAERHEAEQSLLRMFIIMFVDSIAFLIHWLMARRARQSAA
jgi:predicted nucleotidyltransferase component of viral defense system